MAAGSKPRLEEDKMKKNRSRAVLLTLLAAMAFLAFQGCQRENGEEAPQTKEEAIQAEDPSRDDQATDAGNTGDDGEVTVLGEGAVRFLFRVTDQDQNVTSFEIHTDEETVGAALAGLQLIEGEESSYGLYVKVVNGITADYETDGTYWAFYVNGESSMNGVDSTNVEADALYEFKVEK